MAEHNEFGKEGEEEAAAYLIDKGYSIRPPELALRKKRTGYCRRISERTNCYRGKDPQEY